MARLDVPIKVQLGCDDCARFLLKKTAEHQRERDELADALRWIANNVKPYGPAQAHAANTLRKLGLSLEFRDSLLPKETP